METLEYAAKGAAVGLGTVETVADAVGSVLNAYGTENINAARATAVLREAVEQSKREADEVAGAVRSRPSHRVRDGALSSSRSPALSLR